MLIQCINPSHTAIKSKENYHSCFVFIPNILPKPSDLIEMHFYSILFLTVIGKGLLL